MAVAGAHRYWGLYFTSGFYHSGVYVREVELRTSAGGGDVTTPSTPTYTDATYSKYYPKNTVDNDTNTYWGADPVPAPQRLWWDLQTPVAIAEVAVYPYGSSLGPSEGRVQYSDDGSTWTDATETFTLSDASSWQTIAVEQGPPDPNAPQKTTLNLSLAGSAGWTNPSNFTASGNNYAYRSLANTTNSNTTFNSNATSALPAGAVILGVEVSYKAYVNTTGPATRVFTAYPDSPESYPSTSAVIYTKGGPTDKLGVNSMSDLANPWLRGGNTAGGSATLYINSFSISVYWQMPKAGNALFFGELF